ncbi:MAG: TetR/AcrR family transcriptional regulator [Paracoccaceae bacterium]
MTAAEDVLLRSGLSGFNTNAVAHRAGVSIGSLYQFFPGKEAILAALVRNMRRKMLSDLDSAYKKTERADLKEAISLMIEASLNHHCHAPELTEVLEHAEAQLPMDAENQALKADMFQLVLSLFQRKNVDHAETVAQDVIAMCHGMVGAAIAAGERDFDAISSRLKRAAINYTSAEHN